MLTQVQVERKSSGVSAAFRPTDGVSLVDRHACVHGQKDKAILLVFVFDHLRAELLGRAGTRAVHVVEVTGSCRQDQRAVPDEVVDGLCCGKRRLHRLVFVVRKFNRLKQSLSKELSPLGFSARPRRCSRRTKRVKRLVQRPL